jgi:tRNA(Ile)-lysidine synthase
VRKLSVGVERDHEARTPRSVRVAHDRRQRLRKVGWTPGLFAAPGQPLVQLFELASLALPSHPRPLGLAPAAGATEDEEWRRGVPGVQLGDAFRPLGLGGRKKLQDFLVDRKVPRDERDLVPLVVDRDDRIVWVGGHAIDEFFRVSAGTDAVVILKLRGESA